MSLALVAVVVGGGLLVAGAAAVRRATSPRAVALGPPAPAVQSAALGDTSLEPGQLVVIGEHELLLEGAWILEESGEPLATLVFSDGKTLLFTVGPDARSFLLDPVEVELGAELPSTVEHDARIFERASRRPTRLSLQGRAPPPPATQPLLAEYVAIDDCRLWVVGRRGQWSLFRGRAFERALLDDWGKPDRS